MEKHITHPIHFEKVHIVIAEFLKYLMGNAVRGIQCATKDKNCKNAFTSEVSYNENQGTQRHVWSEIFEL